jgi:hypothetical protein
MLKRLAIFAFVLGVSFCFILFFQKKSENGTIDDGIKFSAPAGTSSEMIVLDDLPQVAGTTTAEFFEQLEDIAGQIEVLEKEIGQRFLSAKVAGTETEKFETSSIEMIASSTAIAASSTKPAKKEIIEPKNCPIIFGAWPERQVIINELAWAGTIESANNEWIELNNLSFGEIDLTGWQLIDSEKKIKIFFQEGDKISANSFYLLERTDDQTLPEILADKIYSGGLKNSGENLYLFDQDCRLQDALETAFGWPAGDNNSKRTMERKADFSWQTSASPGGTPKRENSLGFFQNYFVAAPPSFPEPFIACSPDNFSLPEFSPVIINEIAWMGNASSSANEWVELKNITSSTVSLASWQLLGMNTKTGKNNIEISFGQAQLPAESFYFLERSDDEAVLEVVMDKSYTGALNDSDFVLRLFDQNCQLQDEVWATSSWPAGQKEPEKKTAERGEDLLWHNSWATTSFAGLFGTPKTENSQLILPATTTKDSATSTGATTTLTVVINEVAWAGDASSSANEWIELYNNATSDINLQDWTLSWSHGTTTFTSSSVNLIIPANGFYLLERTDDNSVPGVLADLIYAGALKNDGELMELRDNAGNLIDSVDCFLGWFAGDNVTKQTMERIDSLALENNAANWASSTNSGGTPKAQNSVSVWP